MATSMQRPGAGVSLEARGAVCRIGLDRVSKRNAFDRAMLTELARAMTIFEDDPRWRCAVLFAHGEHFTAGLDLRALAPEGWCSARLFPDSLVDPLGLRGRERTKPLISAAHGWCLTLGIELLLASDIRVCAPQTRFAQIEVARGLFPFAGATLRFPREVGWGNAMRYMLTGDTFGADEAWRMGLVQEISAGPAPVERALELAAVVAKQAPLGVRATLASARVGLPASGDPFARHLDAQVAAIARTEDAREGLRSFEERREGEFHGR